MRRPSGPCVHIGLCGRLVLLHSHCGDDRLLAPPLLTSRLLTGHGLALSHPLMASYALLVPSACRCQALSKSSPGSRPAGTPVREWKPTLQSVRATARIVTEISARRRLLCEDQSCRVVQCCHSTPLWNLHMASAFHQDFFCPGADPLCVFKGHALNVAVASPRDAERNTLDIACMNSTASCAHIRKWQSIGSTAPWQVCVHTLLAYALSLVPATRRHGLSGTPGRAAQPLWPSLATQRHSAEGCQECRLYSQPSQRSGSICRGTAGLELSAQRFRRLHTVSSYLAPDSEQPPRTAPQACQHARKAPCVDRLAHLAVAAVAEGFGGS